MENNIFRKSSLERITSPEQLNEYIRISKPGIWIILAALLVLTLALFAWGVFGNIPDTINATGEATGGKLVCYLSPEDAEGVQAGMEVRIGDVSGRIANVSDTPLSYNEAAALCENDYTMDALQLSNWNIMLTIDAAVQDGLHQVTIITENVKPISFLTN